MLRRKLNISREWLEDHYVNKNLSSYKCASIYGCCHATILKYLQKYDIPTRSMSEALSGENHPNYGKTGRPCYWAGKTRSLETRRKISEAERGENHYNWKGGKSYEPYCSKFNNEFKEHIRESFNRQCFICGMYENDRRLSIHHVDYNKNTLCNGKSWGFIPLCGSCHIKTNHNRWYWFNMLGNYWAMNPEINFDVDYYIT